MSAGVPIFNTPYLNDYLKMVEDTESPRIFHVWSSIFAVSAALGRRCWFPFGTFDIFPNHYILLVGTPGTRKTTAANQSRKTLRGSTGVRFSSSDTGGQRQGLMLEILGNLAPEKDYANAVDLGATNGGLASLGELESVAIRTDEEVEAFIDTADKHHIAIVASEFSRLIGQNNASMLDFLGDVYDGEAITYRTRQTSIELKNPLINLMACTTPTHINNSLPPAAGGQGFLSRMILVYGARKHKSVPRPQAPPIELVSRVKEVLSGIYYGTSGAFGETADGRAHCESLYGYTLEISDARFGYYAERRFTHLIKLAMCLAAARGDSIIVKDDYDEAHRILRATERGMPDALGEFGMNPLAMLKQEILEQLRAHQGPLKAAEIVAMFHRDARSHEITEVLNDLIRMGQVVMNQTKGGERVMSAVMTKANTEDAMMKLLAE